MESLFVLYQVTGDPQYQDWGWHIFRAFETFSKVTSGGYTNLDSVLSVRLSTTISSALQLAAGVLCFAGWSQSTAEKTSIEADGWFLLSARPCCDAKLRQESVDGAALLICPSCSKLPTSQS